MLPWYFDYVYAGVSQPNEHVGECKCRAACSRAGTVSVLGCQIMMSLISDECLETEHYEACQHLTLYTPRPSICS